MSAFSASKVRLCQTDTECSSPSSVSDVVSRRGALAASHWRASSRNSAIEGATFGGFTTVSGSELMALGMTSANIVTQRQLASSDSMVTFPLTPCTDGQYNKRPLEA